MKRRIIRIDEDKCNGCGDCIPNCPEGAIQLIDSKARLISDLFCDGLGACIGRCPEGAITVEEREAEPYDELKAMENVVKGGLNVVRAHLDHLMEHGETEFLRQAIEFLTRRGLTIPTSALTKLTGAEDNPTTTGCPGTRSVNLSPASRPPDAVRPDAGRAAAEGVSELRNWPIQLHLVNPHAPHFKGQPLLLSADCVAYSLPGFHSLHLKGRVLTIACPKLDQGQESYLAKLRALIEDADISSIKVMIMEVPCCSGLLRMVQQAVAESSREVPLETQIVRIQG
jgi:ferredoxin